MCIFFFFKQKTAYEVRISDWSSDVRSSDLAQSPSWMLPPRPGKRVAARPPCTASAARINVLDGTQPTLTQVPPITPWPISATFAPSSAALIAAEEPAEPAPTPAPSYPARMSAVRGTSLSGRVDLGGSRT